MTTVFAFGVGVLVGAVAIAHLRHNESACAKRVAAGVREKIVEATGAPGGAIYDASGLGNVASPLLDFFGVPYDA